MALIPAPIPAPPFQATSGGAAWDPAAIAGHAWSLVADPAYQWQDTAQTTPATAATDPIRRWRTRYGIDLPFDAPSDSARPLVTTTGLGGGRGAIFDGGNDDLVATSAGIDGAQWWAFRFAWGASFARYLAYARTASGLGHHIARIQTSTSVLIRFANTVSSPTIAATLPGAIGTGVHTLVVEWDGVSATATSSLLVTYDGSSLSLAPSGNASATGAVSRVYVGSLSSTLYGTGTVGKVSTGSGALTAGERSSLITWLGTP